MLIQSCRRGRGFGWPTGWTCVGSAFAGAMSILTEQPYVRRIAKPAVSHLTRDLLEETEIHHS